MYKLYLYKNNLKIISLKKGVGIGYCYKKYGNKMKKIHLPALSSK